MIITIMEVGATPRYWNHEEKIRRQRVLRMQWHEEWLDQYRDTAFQFKERLNPKGPAGWFVFALLLSSIVLPVEAEEGMCEAQEVMLKKSPKFSGPLNKTLEAYKQPNPMWGDVNKYIPRLEAQEIEDLYSNVQLYQHGTTHHIFTGVVKEDRNYIPAGTKIALRCGSVYPHISLVDSELLAQTRLSSLRSITSFFPDLYGIWQGPWIPSFSYKYWSESTTLLCKEVSFLDGPNYAQAYGDYGEPVRRLLSPRELFEHYLGSWTEYRLAGLDLNELGMDTLRHRLLTWDKNFAIYDIGGDLYVFPPGYSPRRIDYDHFAHLKVKETGPFVLNCGEGFYEYYSSRVSSEAKSFMRDICAGRGLFSSIREHFETCRVSEENPLPHPNLATYYHIPAAYLED